MTHFKYDYTFHKFTEKGVKATPKRAATNAPVGAYWSRTTRTRFSAVMYPRGTSMGFRECVFMLCLN